LAGERFFVGVVQLFVLESLLGDKLLFPAVVFRFRLCLTAGRVSKN
jgi:hypothetical protein